jgi:hypothetical protein
MKVEVLMAYGRPHICFSNEPEPEIIDVQDGQRLYEILDRSKVTGPDVRYLYRSSQ